ncbi:hypothetical protein K440DRAFT_641214 [Wilcoxina mikolae CBS 423.85]|nr:hypothetical protein K440DRAFT_641214 [Wilcoxina mikolae CBS 423.85]
MAGASTIYGYTLLTTVAIGGCSATIFNQPINWRTFLCFEELRAATRYGGDSLLKVAGETVRTILERGEEIRGWRVPESVNEVVVARGERSLRPKKQLMKVDRSSLIRL